MKSVSNKVRGQLRNAVKIPMDYYFFRKYQDQLMPPRFLGAADMRFGFVKAKKSSIHFDFILRVNTGIFELPPINIIEFIRGGARRGIK